MALNYNPLKTIFRGIKTVIGGFFKAVHEINEKYKTPSIKMTPMVNASLLILRIYLLGMVILLCYKFVSILVFKK